MRNLWQKYGNLLIGVSVAIVIGTAAGVGWSSYRQSRNETYTASLLAAVAPTLKTEERASKLASLAHDASGKSHAALAALQMGALLQEQGRTPEAQALYTGLAADRKQDEGLRAVGALEALNAAGATGEWDAKALVPDADSPFSPLQREAQGWALLKAGRKDAALAQFATLKDDVNAPLTQRQRMQMAVSYLRAGE